MAAPILKALRTLPPGARFQLHSDAGGVAARGCVLGPGAAGGVAVAVASAGERSPWPDVTEWSGELKVESVRRAG